VRLKALLGGLLAVLVMLVTGATAAFAQYPPSVGAGRVTRSAMKQCQCTTFSGDGFKPGSSVTITDEYPDGSRHAVATVVADSKGRFTTKVCYDEKSAQGAHTLIASGTDANGNPHEDRAVVNVHGTTCFMQGDEVHGSRFDRGEGGLPRTGTNTTVPALLLGFGLVVAGSGVVLVFRRRTYASL
jgi:LPXTG-motif cell wall-anchored protein